MNRWSRRMVAMGLLAGGALTAGGCFYREQDEDAGRPHTPIQQKYQPGAAGAAQDLDADRQGLSMPDWQNHPTMDDDLEEEAWRAREPGEGDLRWTPTIPPPEEAYQTAEDVLAPRADEDAPEVETPETGIGGAGGTEPIPDAREQPLEEQEQERR